MTMCGRMRPSTYAARSSFLGFRAGSDRLEVPTELPVGDRALVLADLPVAGPDVVIDESLTEDRARPLARRELRRRLLERPRKRGGPLGARRVTAHRRRRLDLV